jgi:chromosome segregation ATPase
VASVATSLRLQAADSQLASLTKESQAGSANVETLSQDYSKLTQLYKQGAAQLEAKTNEAQATERALQRAEQESASTKQQLERAEKDLGAQKSSLTTRLSQATQKLTELGQDLISARQSLQTAETRAGQAEARVAALEAEKAKMERASRRLADTVGELEAVQTQHEKARADFIQQVAALRQELDTLWNTHEQTAQELATASEAAAQQTGRADGAELALKLCRDELAVAQAKAASGEESEAQRQLEASQAELQQVGGQLSAVQARIAEVTAAAATAASEDSALEASLRKQLASLQTGRAQYAALLPWYRHTTRQEIRLTHTMCLLWRCAEKQAAEDAASKRIASVTSSGEAAAKKAAQLQQQLEATQEQLRAKTAELEQAVRTYTPNATAAQTAATWHTRGVSNIVAAGRHSLAQQQTNT